MSSVRHAVNLLLNSRDMRRTYGGPCGLPLSCRQHILNGEEHRMDPNILVEVCRPECYDQQDLVFTELDRWTAKYVIYHLARRMRALPLDNGYIMEVGVLHSCPCSSIHEKPAPSVALQQLCNKHWRTRLTAEQLLASSSM